MAGINKVILIGNLGKDPEVRFMPSGVAVANLTLATSESWKDKQTGEQKEKTEWHRVAIFGKLAEVADEYLKKGSKVYIEGQLQTRKWQNQQGQDQYTTEVVVQGFNGVMQMLDSRNGSGNGNHQQNSNTNHDGGFQGQNQGQNNFNQQPQQGGQNNFGAPAHQPMQQGGYQQQPQQGQHTGVNQVQQSPQEWKQQQSKNTGYNQASAAGQKQARDNQLMGDHNQSQDQAPQGGYQRQNQAQHPKVNPQEPSIDFDDDIPF